MIPVPIIVRTKEAVVIERLGKFSKVLDAGLYIKMPWERVAGRISLRVQELQVSVETKTNDDVFVKLIIAVQYYVIPTRVKEAFYELSNPIMQIESYIFDEVRSVVPSMPLDEVFQNKEDIANAVKTNLQETMTQYGYEIVRALVNDIDPDARVKMAMNEINAATRLRKAAEEKGEGERILKVKAAQGDAEARKLQGEGIANQRKAIIDGLRDSIEEFQSGVPGATANDVMALILMTQYFDMLKEVGQSSHSNTILVPHSPGGMADFAGQIRDFILQGNLTSDSHKEIKGVSDEKELSFAQRKAAEARERVRNAGNEPQQDNPPQQPQARDSRQNLQQRLRNVTPPNMPKMPNIPGMPNFPNIRR